MWGAWGQYGMGGVLLGRRVLARQSFVGGSGFVGWVELCEWVWPAMIVGVVV